MPDLVGSLATYDGDPTAPVLVSLQGIIDGCSDNDLSVPGFLTGIIGDGCPSYLSTQGQVISDAQTAAAEINTDIYSVTPCDWMRYFAPLIFNSQFSVQPTPPEGDEGYWRIFGIWIHVTRTRVFPIPSDNCWETTTKGGSRFVSGFRPVIVGSVPNTPYCFWDDNHESFTNDGQSPIPGTFGDFFIRTGTGTVAYLGVSEDGGPPTNYLNGAVFMPIPPIPDGFPAPPAPPMVPLTGSAVLEALSDDDCSTIVERGGGFQTITDIADEYQSESDTNRDDYHNRTDSPYAVSVDYLESLLAQINVTFWETLNLGQTTGEAAVTLVAMIDAYNDANDNTKKAWLEDNTRDWILFDLLNAFALADTEETLKHQLLIILQRMMANPMIFDPVVELHYDVPNSNISFSIDTDGKLKMVIKVGRDIVGSQATIAEITGRYCDGDLSIPTAVLSAVNEVGASVTDEGWKRLVLDILYQLRECCNPCPEPVSENQYDENFWGQNSTLGNTPKMLSMQTPDIYRVTFGVIENRFPKTFYYGTPPLQLLAKFAWLDSDGRWGPIEYINLDATTKTAPNNSIIGYMCHCYDGVALHAAVNKKFGPSNPPINSTP